MLSAHLDTPLGPLHIGSDGAGLTVVSFTPIEGAPAGDPHGAIDALSRYFGGELDAIDGLPRAAAGTAFQQRVWDALTAIPVGATTTYGALAASLGDPKAVRAVARANGANPLGIVVPCHRVIGHDGRLVGYAGGLHRKRWLLAHEGAPGFLVP